MSDLAPNGDGGQVVSTPAEGQAPDTQPVADGQANGADGLNVTDPSSNPEESFTGINPAELPEELKATYNSMLKDYRTKTADIATVRQQATAFNELMNNPQFSKVMENLSNPSEPVAPAPATPLTGDEFFDKLIEDPTYLDKMIETKARELIDPIAKKIYDSEAGQQINEMRTKYPDFQANEPKIAELIGKYEGLSLEEAYKLSTYDKAIQTGVNKAKELEAQRGNAAQPDKTNSNVEPSKAFSSVREAFEAAKRSAGWTGK